jgi:hypothetical protein
MEQSERLHQPEFATSQSMSSNASALEKAGSALHIARRRDHLAAPSPKARTHQTEVAQRVHLCRSPCLELAGRRRRLFTCRHRRRHGPQAMTAARRDQ